MSFPDRKQRENVICLNEAPSFGGWRIRIVVGGLGCGKEYVFGRRGLVSPPILGARDPQSAVEYEFSMWHKLLTCPA